MVMIPNFILGPHNRLRPKTLDPMQTPYSLQDLKTRNKLLVRVSPFFAHWPDFPFPPTAPQKGLCPSRDKMPNGARTFYHSCPSPRRVIIDVVNDIDGTPCSMISISYASKVCGSVSYVRKQFLVNSLGTRCLRSVSPDNSQLSSRWNRRNYHQSPKLFALK